MNQTAIKYIIALIIGITLIIGCEPCDECGPDNAYPYFKLSILNRTSLDTLIHYRDRINNELKEVQSALADSENAPVVDSLNRLKEIKTDSLSLIKALISTTNKKTISIESINGTTNLFENKNGGDSLSKFRIPLSTVQEEAEYIFKIEFDEEPYFMKISYNLLDTVINNKITEAAKNLQVIEYQFDSLRGPFGCKPASACISNDLEIYVEI